MSRSAELELADPLLTAPPPLIAGTLRVVAEQKINSTYRAQFQPFPEGSCVRTARR